MGDTFTGRSTVVLPCVSESLDENFTSTEENQVTVNQTFEDETGTRQKNLKWKLNKQLQCI